MANRTKLGVQIKVHETFFDGFFERERRKMENELGVRLSQIKFTEIIQKNGLKLNKNKFGLGLKNVTDNRKKRRLN